ncbi:uncharacterized protein LOC126101344 [Schistocerca cancellata]|uniref:uncharacterized protein LOC126101344 n=1 Tax=Schistocerca cancellata TaxID=274614 RepID=UPI002117B890|nr:uncharacterized protein LOC126101344 [Schistocerca cancellata]
MRLSSQDGGRSVLSMSNRLRFLGEVWPLDCRWFFQAYGAIILSIGLATFVDGALAVCFTWRRLEETTLVSTNTSTSGSAVMKIGLFVRDCQLYSALMRRLDVPQLEKSLEESKRYASRFLLSGFHFMLVEACPWMVTPVVACPGQHHLPCVQSNWSETTEVVRVIYTTPSRGGRSSG